MEPSELADFAIKARSFFRGDWDEDLWRIALPRIAAEQKEVAFNALDDYAIQFGGPRAKFIPSRFFAHVIQLRDSLESSRAAERRIAEANRRAFESSESARIVDADWSERRREIETADSTAIGEAVSFLRSIGWGSPPQDFSKWPRVWILAVSDLLTDRVVAGLDPFGGGFYEEGSGRKLRPIGARDFYREAGKAASSLSGAFGA